MEQKMREVYGMKLIFCIDDKSGMMFFGKKDKTRIKILREWILNYAQGSKLMDESLLRQTVWNNASVLADDDYMGKAEENRCFVFI